MGSNRILGTAIVGLVGAIFGSFSMMLYASTHFANVAGPNNSPPALSAAPLTGGSDQERIVSAVKRVTPSVVSITVEANGQMVVPPDPFSQYFGGPAGPQVRRFQERGSGSGFVYSKSGLIVTNAHVVNAGQGITKIEVLFANGDRVQGSVFAVNTGIDLALIKVNYAKLPPPIEIGDSDKLQAGQWAIAIGEPLQLQQSVTVGVVSGFNRTEPIGGGNNGPQVFKGLLQTSAPIFAGNSGGPLVDVEGRLIGVNQATSSPLQGAQGIGFAIPANSVRTTLASMEKSPGIHSGTNLGYIGVQIATVTNDIRTQLNYAGKGVAIGAVVGGSPADLAGMQPGDVVQKINGKDITTVEEFQATIRGTKVGQTVNLQVWRAGVKQLVTVKVAEQPQNIQGYQQQQQPGNP